LHGVSTCWIVAPVCHDGTHFQEPIAGLALPSCWSLLGASMTARASRFVACLCAAVVIPGTPYGLAAQAHAAPRAGTIIGTVIDSLHNSPLAQAEVEIDGTRRLAHTDADGNFRLDSVPAGAVRIGVFHPLLDSLGLGVVSPPLTVKAGDTLILTLATPSAATLATSACRDRPPPGGVHTPDATGPGIIIGRVLDADTEQPINNVAVSVSWLETEVSKQVGYHRLRHTREATSSAGGDFRLCNLPLDVDGEVHAVRRDGGAAAASDVTRLIRAQGHLVTIVTLHLAPLAAPTIASLAAAATAPTPSGGQPGGSAAPGAALSPGTAAPPGGSTARTVPARHYLPGTAVLTGHVVTSDARPVPSARVFIVGASDSAVTDNAGNFTLRQLPSGTRMLVVRSLGYEPVKIAVELTSRAPTHVTVPFAATRAVVLQPVLVTARYESGLKNVGFDQRRLAGMGMFWTKEEIDSHKANEFHDLFGTVPGIRIDYSAQGTASLMAARDAGACIGYAPSPTTGQTTMTPGQNCGPCLTYVIDGAPYDELEEGDMDTYMRPTEIGAIEIYQPNQAPRSIAGVTKSDCVNVVIWSKAKLGI
jgi:hypothetical protein